jgi:hypothetical protein
LPKKKPFFITTRGNGLLTLWSLIDLCDIINIKGNLNYESVTCINTNNSNDIIITGDFEGFFFLIFI